MATEHNVITDAERHQPKGADAATSGQNLIADGANAAAWQGRRVYLTVEIEDVSSASSNYVVCPCAGTIEKIYSVLQGTIGTADAALTFEITGTLVTSGAITIAYSGSAAGDVDSSSPSATNTLTAGQAIEVINSSAPTNTIKAVITFVILRTDNAAT